MGMFRVTEKPSPDFFNVNEHMFADEKLLLVTPKYAGVDWTCGNVIFRSSLWTENWEPISLGFKKFFNWNESPTLAPPPESLIETQAVEKIDGSLLIVSFYKERMLVRTRGTIDARQMANGDEIDWLVNRYPLAFDNEWVRNGISFLFEWVTPSNQIILRYDQPDIFLVGAVVHNDYSYLTQDALDNVAVKINVRRPPVHAFNSVEDMLHVVAEQKGHEGVCLYYNNGQDIRKIKSLDYLKKHAFKSNCTYKNVLAVWLSMGKPSLDELEHKISSEFDFECWLMAKQNAQDMLSHYHAVCAELDKVRGVVETVRAVPRKDAAQTILSVYKGTPYSSMAFRMLDGKPIDDEEFKKLISLLAEQQNILHRKTAMFGELEDFG